MSCGQQQQQLLSSSAHLDLVVRQLPQVLQAELALLLSQRLQDGLCVCCVCVCVERESENE